LLLIKSLNILKNGDEQGLRRTLKKIKRKESLIAGLELSREMTAKGQ